ncbi:MAG: AtzH-like domain-containing protein [Pseudomonadota bacterium]
MDGQVKARIEGEVRASFDAYEKALVGNDVEALIGLFADDPATLRMTNSGGLFGHAQIAAFRRGRDPSDVARTLTRVEIVVLSETVAVAAATYTRDASGLKGAQTQVWQLRPEGWRVVAAHVSLDGG